MSSITGLISGGGGGGETNIVTDPSKLPKYGIARLGSKYLNSQSSYITSDQATFWYYQQYSDHIALADVSASNTYKTLLNVSNAKGGFLHFVLSPLLDSTNPSSSIRITVDGGDAQEFSYNYNTNSFGYSRLIMGGGFSTANPSEAVNFSNYYNVLNPYESFGSSDVGNHGTLQYDDPVNKVYGLGHGIVYYYSAFTIYDQLNTTRLAFTSSLLIEVKQQVLTNGPESMCFYTLH